MLVLDEVVIGDSMGHSFTSFRGKHVRAKDYKIETWLRLMVRQIDSLSVVPTSLHVAHDYWVDHARNYANGCMDLDLDRYLVEEEERNTVLELCSNIQAQLELFGKFIPKEFLNELCDLQPPNQIREDNLTALYLSFNRAMLKLISGQQAADLENA